MRNTAGTAVAPWRTLHDRCATAILAVFLPARRAHPNFVPPGLAPSAGGGLPPPLHSGGPHSPLGIQGHLPGDDLPGVGGHPAHDGQEAAVGHPFAVVDRLAGADAGEQLVVLVLVHVVPVARAAAVAPRLLAGDRVTDVDVHDA